MQDRTIRAVGGLTLTVMMLCAAIPWAVLVQLSPASETLFALPALTTPWRGMTWMWPVAVGLLSIAMLRPELWTLASLLPRRENAIAGLYLGLPMVLVLAGLVTVLAGSPLLGAALVGAALPAFGVLGRAWVRSRQRSPVAAGAMAWRLGWRSLGMALPLAGLWALIVFIAVRPITAAAAFVQAVGADPAALAALPDGVDVAVGLAGFGSMGLAAGLTWMLALAVAWLVPGHVATRALAQGVLTEAPGADAPVAERVGDRVASPAEADLARLRRARAARETEGR